jgi:uncharacterized membrane protein YphA (DoxX/SURF4 family)
MDPFSRPVAGHVDYVTGEPTEIVDALVFLADVVTDPLNALLLGLGTVAVLGALVGGAVARRRLPDLAVLAETLDGYRDLVPWMLRLSVGLPTVGAGFAGYYFSPVVGMDAVSRTLTAVYPDALAPLVSTPFIRLALIAVGFTLLTGFLTRASAAVGAFLWLSVLPTQPELLLAMEYPFAVLAIVLVGGGRPSADMMFARVAQTPGTLYGRIDPLGDLPRRVGAAAAPYRSYLPTLLRAGLGVTFVFLGVTQKLFAPSRALLVVERYDLTAVVPVDPGLWVVGAGLTEFAVGALLLAGLFTRGAAAVAFLVLTTTLFGLPDDPVLAHVSMFGLTSAVFTLGSGPYSLDEVLARRTQAEEGTGDGGATPAD